MPPVGSIWWGWIRVTVARHPSRLALFGPPMALTRTTDQTQRLTLTGLQILHCRQIFQPQITLQMGRQMGPLPSRLTDSTAFTRGQQGHIRFHTPQSQIQ